MITHKNFTIHQFEELESTNSHAFELARQREVFHGEIIMAKSQKSGKGRLDRKWESPQGNLYFSLVLQPVTPLEQISQISFIAAVALRLALENIQKIQGKNPQKQLQNKWPNDILIDNKKVAGILLESEIQDREARFVVLGVGVNIASSPENTIFPATNLMEYGFDITPEELLKSFLDEFEVLYQNHLNFGFSGIRRMWLNKAWRLKENISVKIDKKVTEGVFEDFDMEGNLLLKPEGEDISKISVADIS